jgi:hypothetical protein
MAEEENACAEPEGCRRQSDLLAHRERRESDIHAIKPCDHKTRKKNSETKRSLNFLNVEFAIGSTMPVVVI